MKKVTTIRIRRGIGETKYCACDDAGNPIQAFNKLSDVRKRWKHEIKLGYVELVRELDKTPDLEGIHQIIETIDTILKSYTKTRR